MSSLKNNPEALLKRLEWTVIRRLDGLLQGDYRTLFRGTGLDLADVREYQPHDDVRYIDWNITARMQTPYVREYYSDREITAWFLLDFSPSIDFGAYEQTKRAVLIEFVTVMARLLTRNGNRVGVMFYGNGLDQVIPARGGRDHVLHILKALQNRPELPRGKETDLTEFFRAAMHIMRRRSMVFALSDFVSPPGWEKALGLVAQKHEAMAVRLYDPLEMEMPDLGLVMMEDSETGEQVLVDTHDLDLRLRFADLAEKREEAMMTAFATAGADVLELSTTDDLMDALLRYAELRGKRIRTGGAKSRAAKGLPPLEERRGDDLSVA